MKYISSTVLFLGLLQCCKQPNNINKQLEPNSIKTESQKLSTEDYAEDTPLPPSPFYGYFVSFTEGDYYHAVFKLLDSTHTSLWMPDNKNIERMLINNKRKLLKISYTITRDYIPEAGDTITMEFIKTIEVIKTKSKSR